MNAYPVCEFSPWYHGSPLSLSVLAAGSTVTQWRALAEAFSHKPSCLAYDSILGAIAHDGVLPGRLYVLDEPVILGTDLLPHPRTTMDPGVEWLTTRPLQLRLIAANAP